MSFLKQLSFLLWANHRCRKTMNFFVKPPSQENRVPRYVADTLRRAFFIAQLPSQVRVISALQNFADIQELALAVDRIVEADNLSQPAVNAIDRRKLLSTTSGFPLQRLTCSLSTTSTDNLVLMLVLAVQVVGLQSFYRQPLRPILPLRETR